MPSESLSDPLSPKSERGLEPVLGLPEEGDVSYACLAVQSPDYYGRVVLKDDSLAQRLHESGALLVVSADPMSLALFRPPGELGADIAVGEGQSLGLPLSFGGPYVGLFTTRMEHVRQMPGRVVGQTTDSEGRRAFVLTLQAREQHIRRERAVSNICTSEQLIALAVTVYLSAMGRHGLAQLARLIYDRAHYAAAAIDALPGWGLVYPDAAFFQEFAVHCPLPYAEVNSALHERGIVGGLDVSKMSSVSPTLIPPSPLAERGPGGEVSDPDEHRMLFAVTETNSRAEIDALVAALSAIGKGAAAPPERVETRS
jgi:glycine dehydrogenase subunit 1